MQLAREQLEEARLLALPTGGVSMELNRSTGNTVPGAFFAAPGFVPIAGPVRGRSLDSGVWQTGIGAWVSWDVLSLLREAAAVDRSVASTEAERAELSVETLELGYAAGEAWLQLSVAEQGLTVADAAVARTEALAKLVRPLVDQALRSGADLARLDAEAAAATTQLARARQTVAVRRAQLAQWLALPEQTFELGSPGERGHVSVTEPEVAPKVRVAEATLAKAASDEHVVRLEFLPRVDLVAALWARGTGLPVGTEGPPASGLVPDVANWGAGLVATWPIFDVPRALVHGSLAATQTKRAEAKRLEVALLVDSEVRLAAAVLESARAIAQNTPRALEAAQRAEVQARARFEAGLTSVAEITEAQRQLVQAQTDDAVAQVDVWRALLLQGRARGSLVDVVTAVAPEELPACGSFTPR